MSISYIKRAEQGNRSALSFVASICLCLGSLLLAGIPLYSAIFIKKFTTGLDGKLENTMTGLMSHFPYPVSYSILMSGFAIMIAVVWFCIKYIHRRKMNTLWSDQDRFRPKEFLKGIVFSLVLFFGMDYIVYLNHPEYFKWVFNADKFWVFFPLACLFVPIQTLAEELIFRGHFYQAFGLATKNKWVSLVICSCIFGSMHFANSEMSIDAWKVGSVYVGSGLIIGFTVLISKGIEFGWAYHLINNLYLSVFVTFPGSSLDGPTLYEKPKPTADWILTEFFIVSAIMVLIISIIYRKNFKSLWNEAA